MTSSEATTAVDEWSAGRPRCGSQPPRSWHRCSPRPGPHHPWPTLLPSGWAGGLYGKTEPTQYLRVHLEPVVEIEVDVAAEHGRWRHALRYLRPRPDLDPADVPLGLDLDGA
ncbi:hypothetical protein [Sphaerisporangium sp. NPDC051011]|uniref:hypothetical protein n=1 Tax=Sphaerisporangium sp. NPDC051011 TaxID=3155792 RepID=UPI0033D4FDF2